MNSDHANKTSEPYTFTQRGLTLMVALTGIALLQGGCTALGGAQRTVQAVPAAQLKTYLEAPRPRGAITVQSQAQIDASQARSTAYSEPPAFAPMGANHNRPAVTTREPSPSSGQRSGVDLDAMASALSGQASVRRALPTAPAGTMAMAAPAQTAAPRQLQQQWAMLKSDKVISATLQRWAEPYRTEVVFETPIDARITGDAVVAVGSDLESAVARLIEGLRMAGYPVQATFFGRHALHIREVPR
jgi:hypothetical protein